MGLISWIEKTWFRTATDTKCFQLALSGVAIPAVAHPLLTTHSCDGTTRRVDQQEDERVMAPAFTDRVKLTHGTIPTIGLGVYKSAPGAETYEAVVSALRGGYRHVDTAQVAASAGGRALGKCGTPTHPADFPRFVLFH